MDKSIEYINHLLNRSVELLENKDITTLHDIKNASSITLIKLNDEGDFLAIDESDIYYKNKTNII